jgi:Ser/Thr protein kinase RdoA (MazF antagonist)
MTVSEWQNKTREAIPDLSTELLRQYGLRNVRWHETKSWNAILRAEDGARRYCVKVYNTKATDAERSFDDILQVAELQIDLSKAGCLAVIAPVFSVHGSVVTKCCEFWVTVYDWEQRFVGRGDSEKSAQTNDVARAGGATLAKFHEFTRTARLDNRWRKPRVLTGALNLQEWAERSEQLWDYVDRNLREKQAADQVLTQLKEARIESKRFLESTPFFLRSPGRDRLLIHGDFRPENVIIDDARGDRIIDFDFAHYDYLEMDIASAALHFSGSRWLSGERDWRVWMSFIDGYESAVGKHFVNTKRLLESTIAVILKSLSLSFKADQIEKRWGLLKDFRNNDILGLLNS